MRTRIKDIRQLAIDRCRLLLTKIDLELMEPEPHHEKIIAMTIQINNILKHEVRKR